MKLNKTVIISLSIILLLSILLLTKKQVVQQQSIHLFVKVAPYVGISVDKDKIHFGAVPKGGVSRKMIFLYNNDTYGKLVTAKISGNIKPWIVLSDYKFKLSPGENKTLNITLSVPKNAGYGNYTGILNLYFSK